MSEVGYWITGKWEIWPWSPRLRLPWEVRTAHIKYLVAKQYRVIWCWTVQWHRVEVWGVSFGSYVFRSDSLILLDSNIFEDKAIDWNQREERSSLWDFSSHSCGDFLLLEVIYIFRQVKMLVAQSCLTLCDPTDCSHPSPLSTGFPRQEYWSGLPFPSPGDLPDPGIEPGSLALQEDSLLSEPPGKRQYI